MLNNKTSQDCNPTRLQLFLRKKVWWKSFKGDYVIGFSLAEGFCKSDLRKNK